MFGAERRFAPEGGGTGWGAICGEEVGCRFGTLGHGSGTGEGYDVGTGRGGHRGHSPIVPVALGTASHTEGHSPMILRRYFMRKSDALTACFEKALLAKPGLSGTVSALFIVAPDGTVHGAKSLGIDEVAPCVASVVSSIKFPAPTNGSAVQVSYPLQFRDGDLLTERTGETTA